MPTENKLKLNGGEFLLKESLSNEIFTPEDFSEEQLMMKQTIVDFMDREIWPDKMKYEEKNYDLTVQAMKKIGDLGLLAVSLEEKYGGMGMDFVSSMLAVDYVSGCIAVGVDFFVVGEDWGKKPHNLDVNNYLRKMGKKIAQVTYNPRTSSTKIKKIVLAQSQKALV